MLRLKYTDIKTVSCFIEVLLKFSNFWKVERVD